MKIIVLGPTAVGKTQLSIALAEKMDAEIISADSRQCYKYMNIGTDTPTAETLNRVPHYNISILGPSVKDSAAKFCDRAEKWAEDIRNRGKHVLCVGGSTLHQQCLIQPFDDLPAADEDNIRQLEERIEEEGIQPLYHKLCEVDPAYARSMDGLNTQRIVRALDVWMQTGEPFSSFHSDDDKLQPDDNTLVIGLERDRQLLYERINERVDRMFEKGFLREVQALLNSGYDLDDPGLNTVGYKEAIAHLKGDLPKSQMVENMKTKTRRYAKRQLTFFRRWDFVEWIKLDKLTLQEALEKTLRHLAAKPNKD